MAYSQPATDRDDHPTVTATLVRETRVVLVGITGHGKSTLGNILLNKPDSIAQPDQARGDAQDEENTHGGFVVGLGLRSQTTKCDYKIAPNAWGRYLKVVDTPGLFDTKGDLGKTLNELTNVMSLSTPGPHAILFVTRCDVRFTQEEEEAFNKIIETFQEEVKTFLVLVFTRGDTLTECTIEQIIQTAPESMKKVMEIIGNNYAVISRTEDQGRRRREVENLLSKIDWVSKHGDRFYKNDTLKKMTELMTAEIEKIMKERNIGWREAEFMVKRGLAMEKEERFKDLKKKLLVIALVSPIFAVLIGVTGGAAAGLLAGATPAEAIAGGGTTALAALISTKLTELGVYLNAKKEATGKCSIS